MAGRKVQLYAINSLFQGQRQGQGACKEKAACMKLQPHPSHPPEPLMASMHLTLIAPPGMPPIAGNESARQNGWHVPFMVCRSSCASPDSGLQQLAETGDKKSIFEWTWHNQAHAARPSIILTRRASPARALRSLREFLVSRYQKPFVLLLLFFFANDTQYHFQPLTYFNQISP